MPQTTDIHLFSAWLSCVPHRLLYSLGLSKSAALPDHIPLRFLLAFASARNLRPVHPDGTCAFCEFVLETVEGFVINNSTEQDIVSWLGSACSLLPSPYDALCTQEVNQYGPEIINYIISKENPEVVCTQLHLCTSTRAVATKKVQQGTCGICELVVTFAENYLANNGTISELEAAVEQLCSALPNPYSQQCDQFVEAQMPALIQWLINNEPPQQFCTSVGLCGSKKVKGQKY